MSKHTPGPWWVEVNEESEQGPDAWPNIMSENYEVVGSEGMFGHWETDMANARLIASAPELLDALKEALDALGGNDPQDLGFEDSICGKIRQVIAKAEGK